MSKSSVPYSPTFFGGRFFHDDLYTFSSKFHVGFIKLDILALYYEPQYCIIMSKIAPPLSQCAINLGNCGAILDTSCNICNIMPIIINYCTKKFHIYMMLYYHILLSCENITRSGIASFWDHGAILDTIFTNCGANMVTLNGSLLSLHTLWIWCLEQYYWYLIWNFAFDAIWNFGILVG